LIDSENAKSLQGRIQLANFILLEDAILAIKDMPGAAGVKFKPDIAVQKENSEADYGPDMQSLGQLLLAMCIREDSKICESK